MCWDTAGQEEFDALTSAYYRGKLGFFFVQSCSKLFLSLYLVPIIAGPIILSWLSLKQFPDLPRENELSLNTHTSFVPS